MSDRADPTERALSLPPGWPGSGRRRYAAAMARHRRGALSDAALEVFRVLAPRDRDDPTPLLGAPPAAPDPATPTDASEALRLDLLDLLHRLRGPGVAETRRALAAAGPPRPVPGDAAPAMPWLAPALAALADAEPALAATLAEAAPHLAWTRYRYADPAVGPHFPARHAYCALAGGAGAPFAAEGLDIGLFLMAPDLFYRDHAHAAPELYLPLTGPHAWRSRPDAPLVPRPALATVWNDPGAPHAIKVGPLPFLALYAWLDHPQGDAWIVPASDWPRHEAAP